MRRLDVNYSNTNGKSPFKKGELKDVVRPKRRFTKVTERNDVDLVFEMKADIIRVLADLGIVIQNTHTIASHLIRAGWVKTKQNKKDT